ncbi:hypothetical protein CYMTET_2678 [Cymbomonas tetramitiformis]|uniref:Uncharacterized protein n=1 Tax=Cymbomonas tetramitiformis TaxID=36881 RepID=A0AAE0H4N6_9CHLO|nr:hypothetical protein CYMTET_46598 [Cymbomonas tetramitiformis]KAK3289883.1 hypothetical protein CYMTET_2678 [Cymbomonas tetramitiformis]
MVEKYFDGEVLLTFVYRYCYDRWSAARDFNRQSPLFKTHDTPSSWEVQVLRALHPVLPKISRSDRVAAEYRLDFRRRVYETEFARGNLSEPDRAIADSSQWFSARERNRNRTLLGFLNKLRAPSRVKSVRVLHLRHVQLCDDAIKNEFAALLREARNLTELLLTSEVRSSSRRYRGCCFTVN